MSRFDPLSARPAFSLAILLAALAGAGVGLAEAAAPTGGSNGASGGRRGPPAEALAACKSLASGANCAFQHEGRSLSGTCWAPPERPLACRPKDAPTAR